MMKYFVFASVALFGVAQTVGVAAADPKDARSPDATASPTAEKTQPAAPRYCVVETVTGSRIPTKVCKTRDEWKADGFDPLNP